MAKRSVPSGASRATSVERPELLIRNATSADVDELFRMLRMETRARRAPIMSRAEFAELLTAENRTVIHWSHLWLAETPQRAVGFVGSFRVALADARRHEFFCCQSCWDRCTAGDVWAIFPLIVSREWHDARHGLLKYAICEAIDAGSSTLATTSRFGYDPTFEMSRSGLTLRRDCGCGLHRWAYTSAVSSLPWY